MDSRSHLLPTNSLSTSVEACCSEEWHKLIVSLVHSDIEVCTVISVLMIRVEIHPDITLSSKNTLTFPLIMYSKCVRSNLF